MVSSTLAQRRLAVQLRAVRVEAGRSQEDAAVALDCDVTKIYRIESGRTAAKPADVQALGFTYELDRKRIDHLVALARGAKTRGWADQYLDMIPDGLSMLADLEAYATSILDYSVEKVPGLLQTEEYARHVIDLADEIPADRREGLLKFRLERKQRVLSRKPLPRLQFTLHEAALHVEVGSRKVLVDQLAHLRELVGSGLVEINVWPFTAGLHRWMSGAFIVLGFEGGPQGDPSLVYVENQIEARYVESQQQVSRFVEKFGDMWARSVPIKEFKP
ncbi:helix-turn-helix domain-containing protein [Kineosporia sp. J2-2]|uniref:Helix-turn-helix domain-containing protein n=1 Tax=Kineosporia corallincola TaxID=2835133 RepID=A0ABS5TP28_9ACTN|nr:helix-turn-helix transcriptional regulator [Kineosporia corallincola]MBT0772860.1 helix-turn-helix domain-containing protein [Kineosporia corallincola]